MEAIAMAASRSGYALLVRLSSSLPGRLAGFSLSCSTCRTSAGLVFLSQRCRPLIISRALSSHSEATSSSATSRQSPFAPTHGGIGAAILDPKDRPRMPAVPEERPKPTTAVAVVEAYLDKLWRDFFTNPHNWFDNRLKRRAPKYADFKNKLTKEGLWITAKWNPLWVRTELSLMTQFRAVPYDDPLWAKKAAEEEEEKKEKPPLVPPGAWLQEELKAKRERTAAAAAAATAAGTVSRTDTVETWRRSDTPSPTPPTSAAHSEQEQQ